MDMSVEFDPSMSFAQVVALYLKYADSKRAEGKLPVSFLHYVTGRY